MNKMETVVKLIKYINELILNHVRYAHFYVNIYHPIVLSAYYR